MKKILVYFFLLILALPIFSPWGTVTYFVINRDYIENVLCENRNRPSLHCDGKCFLVKKLKQQREAADKDALESLKGLSWTGLYYQDLVSFDFKLQTAISGSSAWSMPCLFRYNSHLQGIFRPPRH